MLSSDIKTQIIIIIIKTLRNFPGHRDHFCLFQDFSRIYCLHLETRKNKLAATESRKIKLFKKMEFFKVPVNKIRFIFTLKELTLVFWCIIINITRVKKKNCYKSEES